MNNHASILGKMAKGKPKAFTITERQRRKARLEIARKARWPNKGKDAKKRK